MGIFLLIGVLCSLSSLSSSSTLQPITAALHSPESLISHPRLPQHSINYWKSLLCLAELRSARYTKSSFVLLFACFSPACSVISSTPFCLHSLVSGQIKKTPNLSYPGAVSLPCYLPIFVSFHKLKVFSCFLQRRLLMPVFFAFFLNLSEKSPSCSPLQIIPFSDSGVLCSLC